MADIQRPRCAAHEKHLGKPRLADQPALLVFVRELTGQRRKQKEGQDEQALCDVRQYRSLVRRSRRAVGHGYHECDAEQVVVEGAEELGEEERQESPYPEQRELRALGARHLFRQIHQADLGLRRRSRAAALVC